MNRTFSSRETRLAVRVFSMTGHAAELYFARDELGRTCGELERKCPAHNSYKMDCDTQDSRKEHDFIRRC
jgi:hypothetical protein